MILAKEEKLPLSFWKIQVSLHDEAFMNPFRFSSLHSASTMVPGENLPSSNLFFRRMAWTPARILVVLERVLSHLLPLTGAFWLRRGQTHEVRVSSSIFLAVKNVWVWPSKFNFWGVSDPLNNLCTKDLCALISSFKERTFPFSYMERSFLNLYYILEFFLKSKMGGSNKSITIPRFEVVYLSKNKFIFSFVSTVGLQSPSGMNT